MDGKSALEIAEAWKLDVLIQEKIKDVASMVHYTSIVTARADRGVSFSEKLQRQRPADPPRIR